MLQEIYLYYLLFLITIFICSFLLLRAITQNQIIFFKKLFIKKKSDLKMHSYLIFQNAGVVIIGLFLIISFTFFYVFENELKINEIIPRPLIFFISIFILYSMSIYDFLKTLHPIFRLITQIFVTYISLTLIEFPLINEEIIPLKVQYIAIIVFWVYVINVANFVDGLDGLIGTTSLGFFLTLIVYLLLYDILSINLYISFLMIPLLISFLIYNKPRAKIFLNDVGSIPIGYIIGFCILNLAKQSEWIMMISIFFYFIFDVTLTLIKKIQKGYYPWARLFDYQFLQPVLKGGEKHFFVLKFIIMYYFLMNICIGAVYFFGLNKFYILAYSLFASLYIFTKFNKFNIKKN